MGRARERAHVSCEKIHKRLTLSIPLYHKTVGMSTINCWLTRARIHGIIKGEAKTVCEKIHKRGRVSGRDRDK